MLYILFEILPVFATMALSKTLFITFANKNGHTLSIEISWNNANNIKKNNTSRIIIIMAFVIDQNLTESLKMKKK